VGKGRASVEAIGVIVVFFVIRLSSTTLLHSFVFLGLPLAMGKRLCERLRDRESFARTQ